MPLCRDCGAWGCVNSYVGARSLCLHCAFVRLTARMQTTRPVVPPPAMKSVEKPVVTHFSKGLPKQPPPIADGKTWPELLAEMIK